MDDEGGSQKRKISNGVSNVRNFLQSIRIRCAIEGFTGLDRQLLAFNFRFLPCLSLFLYAILYIF